MDIILKKWTEEDKPYLIKLCNNADRTYLTGRLPYPYTEECADWWLNMVKEHDGKDSLFRAIVADGEIVGNITIEGKSDIFCKDAEIGYIVDKEYWGRGIATEATRLVVAEAFAALDIEKITSEVFATNKASARTLEKNGFKLEGVLRKAAYKNGVFYDILRYGKLRGEQANAR